MRVTRKKTFKCILELNEEEAKWLHEVMRNPIGGDGDEDFESADDSDMRTKFYHATDPDSRDESDTL